MSQQPPKALKAMLRKMFPLSQWEEIEGDLEEDFAYNHQQHGKFSAKCYYLLDVLRLIKLYFILKKRTRSNNTVMNKLLFFHLKFGLRSLYRQRLYQALNLATLTLGFSCFMLIFLFVYNQRHKDNFLSNPEQIVRLGTLASTGERMLLHAGIPEVMGQDMPEVEHYTRLSHNTVELSVKEGIDSFTETAIYVDTGFTAVFQMELLLGELFTPGMNEVMISERLAEKVFGKTEVVGELVTITEREEPLDFLITGILKDLPVNASFTNDLILPFPTKGRFSLNAHSWSNFPTYFQVAPNTDLEALISRIPDHLKEHTDKQFILEMDFLFRSFDEIKNDPLIGDFFVSNVDGQVVTIFSIVGLVVLLLAIANYVNLLAALSLRRTQEMSIKKVMGASVRALIVQQIVESSLICIIAMILSSLVVGSVAQSLEVYLGVSLKLSTSVMIVVISLIIIIPILLTLIASLYPAILMSGIRFNELLKGRISNSPKSRFVRNSLLTLQFTISTFLIVGTLTFMKQLDFIKSLHKTDLIGEVLVIKGQLSKDHEVLKQGLIAIPEVEKTSISSMIPGPSDNRGAGLAIGEFERQFDLWVIDEDYLDLMGLEMARGDNFYKDDRTNSGHVLINETLASFAKSEPLGKTYAIFESTNTVIGIVKDFPIQSAKLEVEPGMFMLVKGLEESQMFSNLLSKVAIQLSSSDYETAIAKIETVWESTYPDQPFDIEFMDNRLNRVYSAELRMGQLFGTFTGVAIVISCLGILGLLAYLIEVKMKELGIRKVLGAGFFSQVRILTMNIWKVLIISNIIAFPLSYYFLQDWLDSFAFRTEISSGLFLATFAIFCAIIAIAALWQTLKVNRLNPTEILRNE